MWCVSRLKSCFLPSCSFNHCFVYQKSHHLLDCLRLFNFLFCSCHSFYPDLSTHLVFGGKPRIKFYELDEDFKKATVAASEMTHEQMLEILQNLEKNPNYYDPVGDVTEVLLARETTTQDIKDLLAKFNIQRGLTFDISKRPVIHETGDSDPNERKFSHDDVLRDLDPEWDHAEPPSGYDYEEARRKRDTAGRAQADKAAAEYAERKQRQMLEEQAAAAAAAALKEKKDEL